MARMDFKKFLLYTAAGGLIWNAFLTLVGYWLQQSWQEVLKYTEVLDFIAIVAIAIFIVWLVRKHYKKRAKKDKK